MPATTKPRKKKKRPKRPYQVTPMRHAKRRHRGSKRHHGRMMQEAQTMRVILEHMLKKQHEPDAQYHPRHFSKDPEYAFSDARTQRFKRSVPSPDVHYWRPQGPGANPYQQNFGNVVARRQHPHAWRFEERV